MDASDKGLIQSGAKVFLRDSRVGAVGRSQLSAELGPYVAFAKTAKFDIGFFYNVILSRQPMYDVRSLAISNKTTEYYEWIYFW